ERVLDAAVFVAALAALVVAVLLRTADAIARLGLTLADALLLVGGPQLEAVVLQHAHRDAHRRGAAVEDVCTGDDLRQVLPHGIANLIVVTQPVPGSAREQVVPAR